MMKGFLMSFISFLLSYILPIQHFFIVILIAATINIFFGAWADDKEWSFKKAFKAIKYLIGYFGLLLLVAMLGSIMQVDGKLLSDVVSWITWVMLYFYTTNIFRNWHLKQPDNRPIAFIYWVLSFKIIDKIPYLKEFKEQDKKEEKP